MRAATRTGKEVEARGEKASHASEKRGAPFVEAARNWRPVDDCADDSGFWRFYEAPGNGRVRVSCSGRALFSVSERNTLKGVRRPMVRRRRHSR